MSINDTEFYPTPDWLATKMAKLIQPQSKTILEPSAGSGNLVKAIKEFKRYNNYTITIDCIEIEPVLQNSLRGMGCNVVGFDFMNFSSPTLYDCIVMNPPFSVGVNHVLRAYNLIYSGQVIALLNAESIRNPYSKERKLLISIIESNPTNTIEYIENAFTDSERSTDVEVVLIHLVKVANYAEDFFDLSSLSESKPEYSAMDSSLQNQLAIKQSRISELVNYYNLAVNSAREACIAKAKATYYKSLMITSQYKSPAYEIQYDIKRELNSELDSLRDSAWGGVWTVSEFSKLMTGAVRSEFEKKRTNISKLEFTEHNIRYFLQELLDNSIAIFNHTLLDIFDTFTKYYPDNRNHYEGWKSNTKTVVGEIGWNKTTDKPIFTKRRVVLPNIVKLSYNNKLDFDYHGESTLNDVDMVLDRLLGNIPDLTNGIVNSIKANNFFAGIKMESKHFTVKIYMKGTIHLYFKDINTLQKLNIAVGRIRNWLPDDTQPINDTLLKLSRDII